ncbi:MAG: protein rep [Giesbergeria sp.]
MDDDLPTIHVVHTKAQARLMGRHRGDHLQLCRRLDSYAVDRHRKAAHRLSDCCRTPVLYQDQDNGEFVLSKKTCKHRLCPMCGEARSKRLMADAQALVMRMDAPKFVTLTPRSTDDELKVRVKHLRDSFARLRRSKMWRMKFGKGISVVEVTHNKKTDQWHPHIHCIVDGTYCDQAKLSEAWKQATGDSMIVHIRAVPVRSDAIRYVSKYASKTGDFNSVPDHKINEFLDALGGLRTHAIFGPGARKIVQRDKPTRGGKLVPISSLEVFHGLANDGRQQAQRLLTLIYKLGRRRVQNSADGSSPELEAWHSEIAQLLRSIGVEGTRNPGCLDTAVAANPPPISDAHHRPVRLWEESDTGLAAISD